MSEAVFEGRNAGHILVDWKTIFLKMLVGLLALFLALEIVFYLVLVPANAYIRIEIRGTESVGMDELCSIAGISGNEKWLRFDTALAASRLAANPLFETVTVSKHFPDTVSISVTERHAVAFAYGSRDGRTVPVEIDRNGVAFRIAGNDLDTSLPLITGPQFDNPIAGQRLNPALKPLLAQIETMEQEKPLLLASLSEIKIEEKAFGGYDLVLYPVHTPVRVRTDKALNEDAIQYMMLVLDVIGGLNLDIDEIDIRAGTVAYKVKGA